MVTILDELIEYLNGYGFQIEIKDVREFYSSKQPVYPMITVEETRNSTSQQLQGVELFSRLHYTFEIYTKSMDIDDVMKTPRQVGTEILFDLDSCVKERWGLKRVGSPTQIPYNSDNTIFRTVVTYGCKIDNKNMIIYQ